MVFHNPERDASTGPNGPAHDLARDWKPILPQRPAQPMIQDQWFAQMPNNDTECVFDSMTESVTREEVIARLHRGKACGPDRLPNEFY